MLSRTHRPSPPLDGLIDCLWLCEGYAPSAARERLIPSGALDLVINLEEDALRFSPEGVPGTERTERGAVLFGARSEPFVLTTSPRMSAIGVHFKPGGAAPFLDLPLGELAGTQAALDDLWGGAARMLRDRLLETPGSTARFALLEAFLRERARRPLRHGAVLTRALQAFEEPALGAVAEVNARTGLSPKRLIALFRDEVGLTPKAFWRVRRFCQARRAVERGPIRGAELAVDLGYYDQPHLDREFRSFTGMSPSEYRTRTPGRPNHVPLGG